MKSRYAGLFLLLALLVGLISGCGKLEAVKERAFNSHMAGKVSVGRIKPIFFCQIFCFYI